jgi:hypothetical protein
MVIEVEILVQVDAVEQAHHVLDGIDGHAHFANLAHGQRIIGVQPDLRRQVESHAQPGGALAQEILVAPVRLLGVAHAGILPHRPERPRYMVACTPRVKGIARDSRHRDRSRRAFQS